MSNLYQDFKNRVGPMVVVIWPLSIVGLIGCLFILWQDIQSTAQAYAKIPTQKIDPENTMWVVAILLMIAQVVLGYMYFNDTTLTWARTGALIGAFFDNSTDIWFKMGNEWNWALLPWATIETIMVFTVVSEFLVVIFAGFVLQSAGDFVRYAGQVLFGMVDGLLSLFGVDSSQDDVAAATNHGRRQRYANQGSRGRGNARRTSAAEAAISDFIDM